MIHFYKMHGLGNDYIYFDTRKTPFSAPMVKLARQMSMSHFGVGGDGLVVISPPKQNGCCFMRIYNADGSQAEICGNALRCVGLYLARCGEVKVGGSVYVETATRSVRLDIYEATPYTALVGVDMGQAHIDSPPIALSDGEANWEALGVNMGNPHAVVTVDAPWADVPEEVQSKLRTHTQFPLGVNIEGMYIKSSTDIALRVWERGSGETFACGSGACAAVAAGVFWGKLRPDHDISVSLYGGDLWVRCTKDMTLYQKGEATFVYEGETDLACFI